MTTRRDLVLGLAIAPAIPLLARTAFGEEAEATPSDKLETSQLVYITPIKSNGEESRCKAEIWFSHHDGDVFVVTPPETWRAQAVGKGLTKARLWVGDFGVWTRSDAFPEGARVHGNGVHRVRRGETRDRVGGNGREIRGDRLGSMGARRSRTAWWTVRG